MLQEMANVKGVTSVLHTILVKAHSPKYQATLEQTVQVIRQNLAREKMLVPEHLLKMMGALGQQ